MSSFSSTTDTKQSVQSSSQDSETNAGFSSAATGKTSYFNPGPAMDHKNKVWGMSKAQKLEYVLNGGAY